MHLVGLYYANTMYHDARSTECEEEDTTFQKALCAPLITTDFFIHFDDGDKYLTRNVETILLKFTASRPKSRGNFS